MLLKRILFLSFLTLSFGDVSYNYYTGIFQNLQDWDLVPLQATGTCSNITFLPDSTFSCNTALNEFPTPSLGLDYGFGMAIYGQLVSPSGPWISGTYNFSLSSTYGSSLIIWDSATAFPGYLNNVLIANDHYQNAIVSKSNTIYLNSSLTYNFVISFFHYHDGHSTPPAAYLSVSIDGPVSYCAGACFWSYTSAISPIPQSSTSNHGVTFQYYASAGGNTALVNFLTYTTPPNKTGTCNFNYPFDLYGRGCNLTITPTPTFFYNFYFQFVFPPTALSGTYTFWLSSDDGSAMIIWDATQPFPGYGTRVVNNDNPHPETIVGGTISLNTSLTYLVSILYAQTGGAATLRAYYYGPGVSSLTGVGYSGLTCSGSPCVPLDIRNVLPAPVPTGLTAITCSTPALPSNTQIVSGCGATDPYLSYCVLGCSTGFYQTSGSTTQQCIGANTVYSLNLGCSAITCNAGTTFPDGSQVVSGCTSADAYSSTCVLKCQNGFSYTSGSYSRVCNLAAPGLYPTSDLVCTAFTPSNINGVYTNGWTITILGVQILAASPDGQTTYLGSFTYDPLHLEIYINSTTTYTGVIGLSNTGTPINVTWSNPSLGSWVLGAPVAQPYTYPANINFLPDSSMCYAPGFTEIYPWNFCTDPANCHYRRNYNIWEGQRGVCLGPCNATTCASKTGLSLRGTDKFCNPIGGGSFTCANYQPLGATCGGYDSLTFDPQPPYCDWKSVCLNNGTSWTCQNSTCLNQCEYGTYCYTSTTTSDTAVCGGYQVPAFNTVQFTAFLAIYAGFHPGDPLQARHGRHLFSAQTGASLIGQLHCNNKKDCGLTADCIYDLSLNDTFCASPGLFVSPPPIAS